MNRLILTYQSHVHEECSVMTRYDWDSESVCFSGKETETEKKRERERKREKETVPQGLIKRMFL